MTTASKQTTTPRSIAVLQLPTKVGALINYAQTIAKALTGNLHIPNPTPTIAALTTATSALVSAENAALTRVKGAVAARNAAKKSLVQLLELLRANVQNAADADPDNALTVIESAGIEVRKPTVRKPRVFAAIQGALSGSAKLVAPSAGPRSSYEWEVSTRRGQDVGACGAEHPGEDHPAGSAVGDDGAVPLPRHHAQGGRGELERAGLAARAVRGV
jgi:hypothetical protein